MAANESSSRAIASTSTFAAAVVLGILALGLNNITFATNDYRLIVLLALASATVALIFTVQVWKGASFVPRSVLLLFAIGDLQTLVDAGARRLPAVFGW
jgi:hypothetical protein